MRIYGDKGGLVWEQENPNYLQFSPLGEQPRRVSRGGPGVTGAAQWATRIPAGHPEGYFEAFAQLYSDLAEQIGALLEGRAPDQRSLIVPGVEDGVCGVQFIQAVLQSAQKGSAWTALLKKASAS